MKKIRNKRQSTNDEKRRRSEVKNKKKGKTVRIRKLVKRKKKMGKRG